MGAQQLAALGGLFEQQQCRAGAQVGAGEPRLALLGRQVEPVLYRLLRDRQLALQNVEHGLVAFAVGVEAIAQAQRFTRVGEH